MALPAKATQLRQRADHLESLAIELSVEGDALARGELRDRVRNEARLLRELLDDVEGAVA